MDTRNKPEKKDKPYKSATQKQELSTPSRPLTVTATVVDTQIPSPPSPSDAELLFVEIKRALHGESYEGSETDNKNKNKLCNWQLPDILKKEYCEPINCFLPNIEVE